MEETAPTSSRDLADFHGGEVEWEISRRFGIPFTKITSFANTVAPIIPESIGALEKKIHNLNLYPPREPHAIAGLIAEHEDCKPSNVVVGAGSTELIYCFSKHLSPGQVIVPTPTYSEYESALDMYGHSAVFVPPNSGFGLDVEAVKRAVTSKTRAVMVCNPNNPSGRFFGRDQMLELAELARSRRLVLFVDQAYLCFVNSRKSYSMVELIEEYPIFVLNSLSKLFGVPSLRLGWGIGSNSLIDQISKLRIPGTLGNLSLWGGEILLTDYHFQRHVKEFVDRVREEQLSALRAIDGLKVHPTETNYVLIELISPRLTSTVIFQALARQGIVVRDCSKMRALGNRFIRVTIRTPSENAELNRLLASAVSEAEAGAPLVGETPH